MIFGIPREIRTHENRVGALPFVVEELVRRGHEVLVENNAGIDSNRPDEVYEKSGAIIVPSSEKLYNQAEFILKVREPMPVEMELIRPEHTIFAFFHFLSNPEMARSLVARGCSAFAYEWLTLRDGTRPMMVMQGEIAGRMAVQQGMFYLEKHNGGMGKLLGAVTGAEPATVTIIGAGTVGIAAAKMAAQLGARVNLLDIDFLKLQHARRHLPENVYTYMNTEKILRDLFPTTDLLITAIHVPHARVPVLISRELIKLLPRGAVLVDVDIDQGGSVETSHPTNFNNPTFVVEDVIHYCVPNLAGVVPITASYAMSSALLPYLIRIAELGFEAAVLKDPEMRSGLAIYEGRITNPALAEALDLPLYTFEDDEEIGES